jgi:hypothetical protein
MPARRLEEQPMHTGLEEFLKEQTKGLAGMAKEIRKSRMAAARKAAVASAARIKSLKMRVRDLARSGVRLTDISQGAAQSLIELQAEIVNDALTEAAAKLERIAATESFRDIARLQAEVLSATRQRIVDDIARVVAILRGAAGDVRKVAARAEAAQPARPRKAVRRKVKRVPRKPAAKAKARASSKRRR